MPNTTAGLIIGKGGVTIRHIMESTGAKVQLSQKPEQINLQVQTLLSLTLAYIYRPHTLDNGNSILGLP